jgi:hypothetical protein
MKMKEKECKKIVFTIETAMSPLSKRMSQCYKTICAYGKEVSIFNTTHSTVISSRTVHSSIIKKDFLRFPPSILSMLENSRRKQNKKASSQFF